MKTAFIIPCYNEEASIGGVVGKAFAAVPGAEVYVCDNNSGDNTALRAKEAGAKVLFEAARGKGNAVRRLLSVARADVYIMIDGDATYDLKDADVFAKDIISKDIDFINVARKHTEARSYPRGHIFGNFILTRTASLFFGSKIKDMLSGYKIFSGRFAKTFPCFSKGFEIETEFIIFALSSRFSVAERDALYYPRPANSVSKLSTFRDGFKILLTIFGLIKDEKPLLFFGSAAGFTAIAAVMFSIPLFIDYMRTGLVPKLPTAVLATGMMVWALLLFSTGLILDAAAKNKKEIRRQIYLKP